MHMTDALLSPAIGIAMNVVSVAAIGFAVANIKKDELSESKIPIMSVAGAMVFAGQMINFTIPLTGSSGHIGGGILLAGLLGGLPAFLSVAAVLIIQCLFFADGGLLALGCNIFNLGVIPCLVVYPLIFKPLMKGGADSKRLSVASASSALIGLELGAFCVVLETLLSGIAVLPFGTFAAIMLSIHLIIGLVEGIVTATVLLFVYKMRPEIIDAAHKSARFAGSSVKSVLIALIALTVVAGGALSLFASSNPDGLEWAFFNASGQELEELRAEGDIYEVAEGVRDRTTIMPDYNFTSGSDDEPGNANPAGKSISSLIGAGITFALAGAAGLTISIAKKTRKKQGGETNG